MTAKQRIDRFVEEILNGSNLPEPLKEEARQDFVTHLEIAAAALQRDGLTESEAVSRALHQFGSPSNIRQRLASLQDDPPREPQGARPKVRFGAFLLTIIQDIRVALRSFVRRPLLPLIVVLTVAVGIGSVVAVSAVVDAVLLKQLPYPNPQNLVAVGGSSENDPTILQPTSPGNFIDLRSGASTFDGLAAYSPFNVALSGVQDHDAERVTGMVVSGNFFDTIGTPPLLGRTFRLEEELPANSAVAVLSHGLWVSRFGGRGDIVGQTVIANESTLEIVGVMPPGFRVGDDAALWVPLNLVPGQSSRGSNYLSVVGRISDGFSLAESRAALGLVADRLHSEFPQFFGDGAISVIPLRDHVVGSVRSQLFFVAAAAGFVLLIVCVNVANLLVVRTEARATEIAVRASLGAGRPRIIRQLATETLLLSIIGGLLGLGLATYAVKTAVALGSNHVPRLNEAAMNPLVFVAAAVLTLGVGTVIGLVPAMRAGARPFTDGLRGTRGTSQGSTMRFRAVAVGAQIALCLVLSINAALLVQSYAAIQRVDPGFQPSNLLTIKVELNGAKYASGVARAEYFREGLERLRGVGGVSAAASAGFRAATDGFTRRFALADRPLPPNDGYFFAAYNPASAGYFETLGIPVVRGRSITATDQTDAPPVAVVNSAFVREYYPAGDPLGQRLGFYQQGVPQPDAFEIVGVVGDVRYDGLASDPRPAIYIPQQQSPWRWGTFYARTAGDPAAVIASVRRVFNELDPNQPVFSISPMNTVFLESTARERLLALLLSSFALVGLILAISGVFGMASFVVGSRTKELGLRIALGARPQRVISEVVGRGLVSIVAGVTVGLVGAFVTARLLEGTLFGIGVVDPLTYVGVVLLLVAGALVAMYLPARRVSSLDAMQSLRVD